MAEKPIDWERCERALAELYPAVKEELETKLVPLYHKSIEIIQKDYPPRIEVSFPDEIINQSLDRKGFESEFKTNLAQIVEAITEVAENHDLTALQGYYRKLKRWGHWKKEWVGDVIHTYTLKPDYQKFEKE